MRSHPDEPPFPQWAQEIIFKPDWKQVFEPENVIAQVRAITAGTKG